MNMSLLGVFVSNRRATSGIVELLTLPVSLVRSLRAALGRRRWQQAPPFLHMSDHLRRDIGLPPYDDTARHS
ncbi:MAG: hypothetical protein BroJett029_26130 [Alphaproteobacteria bacterium]|nr:MAG: hypothetical protein BroJett029_26130 [Alphaproteobacteria bacterium]